MKPAYFVAPWDLNRDLACVPKSPADGTVLLVESIAKGAALPYHKQKLTLVLASMRKFAEELRKEGFDVSVVKAPTYIEGISQHLTEHGSTALHAMRPREWGLSEAMNNADFGVPLTLHPHGNSDGHFLISREEFFEWAAERKQLRMGDFYAMMRKRFRYLLTKDGKPEGGKWSFDANNRKHARGQTPPPVAKFKAPTETLAYVEEHFPNNFGSIESFHWPTTRKDALRMFRDFLKHRLEHFGDYQDAMLHGQPFMWHTLISSSMNLSLLHPKEVCDAVAKAYRQGKCSLAAAEGLIRQVLGWREFIRGIYWLSMPGLRSANQLQAKRPLPDFFWEPDKTDMRCLSESIRHVQQHGYAHHIHRLMVQGNYALLAGINPIDVSHWFWAAFVDAYEWVELPNVHGMALFADNTFTTKPYAASGNYINKMSDYCKGCRYKVKEKVGEDACPFNYLYWSFLMQHRKRFENNHRMRMIYRQLDKKTPEQLNAISQSSKRHLKTLKPTSGWVFSDDQC